METAPQYQTQDRTVYRKPHNADNPYVVISKNVFEDTAVSWKAKGIMGYLLSRPDDWIVRHGDLVKRSPEGESAVRSAIKELEQHGYLTRTRTKDEQGRYNGIEVLVHENPVPPEERTYRPPRDNPQVDEPRMENPHVENRTLLSIDPILSNECTKEKDSADAVFFGSADPPARQTITTDLPRTQDPLVMAAHVAKRTNGRKSWTVAGPEGADPWAGRPVDAFMVLAHRTDLKPKERQYWPRKLEEWAAEWSATPDETYAAIRAIPDSEYSWQTFKTPYATSFLETMDVMIDRLRNSQPINAKGKTQGDRAMNSTHRDAYSPDMVATQ